MLGRLVAEDGRVCPKGSQFSQSFRSWNVQTLNPPAPGPIFPFPHWAGLLPIVHLPAGASPLFVRTPCRTGDLPTAFKGT